MEFALLFDLVRVTLGNQTRLPRKLTDREWAWLFEIAKRQAIYGICFAGVKNLVTQHQEPSQLIYLKWLEAAAHNQIENWEMDSKTSAIWKQLKKDGLNAAILKGRGIAMLYDVKSKTDNGWQLSSLRGSGDIDVWVKGGYQTVCDYVQRTHPTTDLAYHRFHYDYFKDTEVELHHRPTLMKNLCDDRKLAKWYDSFSAESFVYLEDKGFAVPPIEFNVIFILTHIYRHFLVEGIGLRQVMDYYFVLKAQNESKWNRGDVIERLKEFRLLRFAEAIMWILHTQFGLEKECLICEMNEKEGRFVLSEIVRAGNFGYADSRYRYKYLFNLRRMIDRGTHLLIHYPSEVLWTPIWLIYHKLWKWNKIRKIPQTTVGK